MAAIQNDGAGRFASKYQSLGTPKRMFARSLSLPQYICH
jgi:hypothetical protein